MYHRNKIKVSHHFFIYFLIFFLVIEMCVIGLYGLYCRIEWLHFFLTHSKHAIFLLKLFILSKVVCAWNLKHHKHFLYRDWYIFKLYTIITKSNRIDIESHKWPWCRVFAPLSSSLNDTAAFMPTISSLNRISAALFYYIGAIHNPLLENMFICCIIKRNAFRTLLTIPIHLYNM